MCDIAGKSADRYDPVDVGFRTVAEVADAMWVSQMTVHRLVHAGALPRSAGRPVVPCPGTGAGLLPRLVNPGRLTFRLIPAADHRYRTPEREVGRDVRLAQSVITHTVQTAIIDSAAANWTRAAMPKPAIVSRVAR